MDAERIYSRLLMSYFLPQDSRSLRLSI